MKDGRSRGVKRGETGTDNERKSQCKCYASCCRRHFHADTHQVLPLKYTRRLVAKSARMPRRVSTACYCRSGHMPELLPNLPTFCQLACRISAIAGQFACQYGSHEVTGGTSRAMACCFTCDSTRHCMPMRCMHDDPPRVRPRIMQQAIRHKASSHIPVNPLLYQARASRVWYARFVAMACPFACLLSHTSTILRPTDPPKRSSPRCREASA